MLTESDNESSSSKIPSPSKVLTNNLSSCKTYEQIRLEEIAREADFYSYHIYQNSTGGGKIKADVPKQESNELNFNILSLDEIRQRKKIRLAQEKKDESAGDQFLRDTLRTLDHLRDLHPREEVKQDAYVKRKISFIEAEESESEGFVKKIRTVVESTKVPPIRLKRTRRSSPVKEVEKKEVEGEEAEDVASARAKKNVEIRQCDSSTDDFDQSVDMDEKIQPLNVSANTVELSRENLSTLESASDDILKDIDALLSDDDSS